MKKPPLIKPRVRAKGPILTVLVVLSAWIFLAYLVRPKPPKESELIQNFYAHQAAYERLRDMFLADAYVHRVASYGVAVTNTIAARNPQDVGFPIDRYNEYLGLLRQANVLLVSRGEWENSSDPLFLVWGWGFAGNTRHVGICWKDREPTNRVASLYQKRKRDESYRGAYRQIAYRQIDGHWYLWSDL